MLRPKVFTLTLQAVPDSIGGGNYDIDFFASNVTGASFVLTATTTTDGLAHKVAVRNDAVTDHSAKTLTFVGTDEYGNAQTETIAGPGSLAIVETTKYYKTLTSVTPSATIGADTFDIGISDEVVSPVYPLDCYARVAEIINKVSGTLNYTIEFTGADIFQQVKSTWSWNTESDVSAKTADSSKAFAQSPSGVRAKINTYSSNAIFIYQIIESARA